MLQALGLTSSPYQYISLGATKGESAQLQRSVVALGQLVGDKKLAIKADGIIGPKTAAAVNHALVKYVTSAPANLRTGRLKVAQVKSSAADLTTLIQAEVARRRAAGQAAKAAAPSVPKSAKVVKSQAVRALQQALRALGAMVPDRVLLIGVDGIAGPKTAFALNKAMVEYVAGGAPEYKTGKLTPQQVHTAAAALVQLVNGEIARRKVAGQKATAAPKPVTRAQKSTAVANMQRVVAQLGSLVGDSVLKIKADGIIGPKTTAAVNRAMSRYVSSAPPALKGGLTGQAILTNVYAITALTNEEISRRAGAPLPATRPAPVPTPAPMPAATPRAALPPMPAPSPLPAPVPAPVAPEVVGEDEDEEVTPGMQPAAMVPGPSPTPIPAPGVAPATTTMVEREGAEAPAEAAPSGPPWKWIGIAAGGVFLVTGLVVLAVKSGGRRSGAVPRPRPA